jgi:hypothetical protein
MDGKCRKEESEQEREKMMRRLDELSLDGRAKNVIDEVRLAGSRASP